VAHPVQTSLPDFGGGTGFLNNDEKLQYAIYIEGGDQGNDFSEIGPRSSQKISILNPNDVEVGDVLKLRFDFTESRCDFFFNGSFYATMCEDLPAEVVPAMACCGMHELECTDWKMFGKGY